MRSALLALVGVAALGGGRAEAGTGAGLVRYFPEHPAQVLVVDVAHARSGAAAAQLVAQLRAHSARLDAAADAGVDLVRGIDTFVVAATEAGAGTRHTAVIVEGSFVGPLLAHMKSAQVRPVRHAGITVWPVDGAELAVIDRRLVITSPGDMASTIDRARGLAVPPPEVGAMLGAFAGAGADIWGGMVLGEGDRASATSVMGAEPRWIAFSVAASARVALDVRIELADEPAARAALVWVQHMLVGPDAQLLPALQAAAGEELVDTIAVERDRTQVRISGVMSLEAAGWLGNILGSGP